MNEPEAKPALRVQGSRFDVRKRGIARVDWRDPYHFAVTASWPTFVAAALATLLIINLSFATLYAMAPGSVENLKGGDLPGALFFSLETLATVGYGEMAPADRYGHVVAAGEILVGMASTAILTGILFVRFSKPRPCILFADAVVVCRWNGQPTLMVRVANGRLNLLTTATARLGVLLAETTLEGQFYRRLHDLQLVRADLPIFPLTWTLMHIIDRQSPLADLAPADLVERGARLFVTVTAWDRSLATVVQEVQDYECAHIQFGRRYVDAVSADDSGRSVADLARISLTELEPAAAAP